MENELFNMLKNIKNLCDINNVDFYNLIYEIKKNEEKQNKIIKHKRKVKKVTKKSFKYGLICECCGKILDNPIKIYNGTKYVLCPKHKRQMQRHGKLLDNNPRTTKECNEIILYEDYAEIIIYYKNGEERARTLIDLDDVEKVKDFKWCADMSNYITGSNKMKLHRFIMNCPDDMVIDHINHNPLDNRKKNLRICTSIQNSYNQKITSRNKTGIIGISVVNGLYYVRIAKDNQEDYLGMFDDFEKAVKVRLQAEKVYFGEFAPQKHLFKQYGIE